jgi:hypothetical protein
MVSLDIHHTSLSMNGKTTNNMKSPPVRPETRRRTLNSLIEDPPPCASA